jgi:LysR family glycine cleavage system transcriptional activator
MKIRSPSLPELHAFVAVSRLGSTVRAAEHLHVTQGTVSRAVQRLEDHLGTSLFDRHRRGTVLNAAGKSYLASVAPALDTLEQAAAQLRSDPNPSVLRISVIPAVANHWLIRRLPDFTARHPDVELGFVPYKKDSGWFLDDTQASIRGGDAAAPPEGLEKNYLFGKRIAPVCSPRFCADLSSSHGAEQLKSQPLLFHTSQPEAWAIWFAAMGSSTEDIKLHLGFDQVSQLLEAAAAGLGIAMVQHCLAIDYLETHKLALAWPASANNTRGYYLYHPTSEKNHRALQEFKSWLLTEAEKTHDLER